MSQTVLSLWKGPLQREPSMREIAERIAYLRGITLEDMRGPSRKDPIVTARQQAMAAIMATGRFTTTQCGRFFRRDHSTVCHAVRRVKEAA
jgi:chromosomal replication initiator protein